MGTRIQMLGRLGILFLFFSILGCQKPKLRTDSSKDSKETPEKAIAKDTGNSYEEIRKGVIGQTFETLTLGSRQFTNAAVRDITDQAIVIAHAGGVDTVSWNEVTVEVRERWGYNPFAESLAGKSTMAAPEKDKSSGKENVNIAESPSKSVVSESKTDPQERAMKIAQKQKMLDAQLVGIRSIESDLARHSLLLNQLRGQLQSIRSLQSGQRSGGIRVERVGGKSKFVDRESQAREVESKIKMQEQFVTQFSKSLQVARKDYQAMKIAVDQLLRE